MDLTRGHCAEGLVECRTDCIHFNSLGNGNNDCIDGSDEMGCPSELNT